MLSLEISLFLFGSEAQGIEEYQITVPDVTHQFPSRTTIPNINMTETAEIHTAMAIIKRGASELIVDAKM